MNLPEQSKNQKEQPTEQVAPQKKKRGLTVREITIFSMLGALMFCSKLLLDWAPNIHLLAMFITVFTLVYRKKALVPIYVFVFITGVYGGFNLWWLPYLYIWTVLWGVVMLLPRKMKPAVAVPVYMAVCSLHGFLYGVLYAPAQALLFHLNFQSAMAWVIAGFSFDILHGLGNLAAGALVLPMANLLQKLEHRSAHR